MTDRTTMWQILKTAVPRKEWMSIADIFAIVESKAPFDDEDLWLNSMKIPAWKLTICRILREKKQLKGIRTRKRVS